MVIFDRLYERIMVLCPALTTQDFMAGYVVLRDDGEGAYIEFWTHPTITRPTDEEITAVNL